MKSLADVIRNPVFVAGEFIGDDDDDGESQAINHVDIFLFANQKTLPLLEASRHVIFCPVSSLASILDQTLLKMVENVLDLNGT